MREDIRELLKRYDEIGALILEQKLDEFGDKLDQKPDGVDDATYEEYIQRLAKEETDEATFSVYIALTDSDLNGVAYGMNAIVTSQSDSRKSVRMPLEDQEEEPSEEAGE